MCTQYYHGDAFYRECYGTRQPQDHIYIALWGKGGIETLGVLILASFPKYLIQVTCYFEQNVC